MHAVDGVSLDLSRGETLGLVGESGCGKSTLGRCVVRLYDLTERHGDASTGRTSRRSAAEQMRPLRREMQMVFQDPYAIAEPAQARSARSSPSRCASTASARRHGKRAVQELLERVGLSPEHDNRYPHEFSGGQRQRIGVARALALEPEADRRRRAGLGARRVDPGAGRQPAGRPAGRARPDLSVHRARPGGGAPRVRPDRGHVPGQDRRGVAGRGAVPAADPPVHRGAALAVPIPDPELASQRERIVLEGDVPSPITRPAVAVSTHAAAMRPRSAPPTTRRWSTTATATSPPATTR